MPKVKDLTGQRFGKLTAIRPTHERRGGHIVWECRCDCGEAALVSGGSLKSGRTQSCGCLLKGSAREIGVCNAVDIAGQRFGKLIAVRATEERRNGSVIWECRCDCGSTVFVATRGLRSGSTRSCGCLTISIDLTGQRFGKLTAVRPTEERLNRQVVWECVCDCGNSAFVGAGRLHSGAKKACDACGYFK